MDELCNLILIEQHRILIPEMSVNVSSTPPLYLSPASNN